MIVLEILKHYLNPSCLNFGCKLQSKHDFSKVFFGNFSHVKNIKKSPYDRYHWNWCLWSKCSCDDRSKCKEAGHFVFDSKPNRQDWTKENSISYQLLHSRNQQKFLDYIIYFQFFENESKTCTGAHNSYDCTKYQSDIWFCRTGTV